MLRSGASKSIPQFTYLSKYAVGCYLRYGWFPRIPSVRGRPRPYHWNDLSDEKDEEFSDGRLCVGRGSVARGLVLATCRSPLREAGHEAYPVTLTGLGERSHLSDPEVNLDTH